jgi:hypothetical protein
VINIVSLALSNTMFESSKNHPPDGECSPTERQRTAGLLTTSWRASWLVEALEEERAWRRNCPTLWPWSERLGCDSSGDVVGGPGLLIRSSGPFPSSSTPPPPRRSLRRRALFLRLVVLRPFGFLQATSQGDILPALAFEEGSRREPHFLRFAEDQPLSALLTHQYHAP